MKTDMVRSSVLLIVEQEARVQAPQISSARLKRERVIGRMR